MVDDTRSANRAAQLVEALSGEMPLNLSAAEAACDVAARIAALPRSASSVFVGINGAQGSGKSTLTRLVAEALARFHGLRAAGMSLDDFYLTRAERLRLAREVHPLCATRGVPGTHDVELMRATIARLCGAQASETTPIPAFDKLADDRAPPADWPVFTGRPGVIMLEGWCVGVRRGDLPPYEGPINELERAEDPDGVWYRWSIEALGRGYEDLWDGFDLLVSIEVPDLETVIDSRLRQEDTLAAGSNGGGAGRPRMDRAAVIRFVQHYERYTRALWAAMPGRADMLYRRDRDYGFTLIKG